MRKGLLELDYILALGSEKKSKVDKREKGRRTGGQEWWFWPLPSVEADIYSLTELLALPYRMFPAALLFLIKFGDLTY